MEIILEQVIYSGKNVLNFAIIIYNNQYEQQTKMFGKGESPER